MENKNDERFDAARRDTVRLTLLSMLLQAAGLTFNALLSRREGTAAVGIMSLIFSFFGCIMVLANGNIFIITSRAVSQDKECGGDISVTMKKCLTFSAVLSGVFSLMCFIFSQNAAVSILRSPELGAAVRMISLSLMPAAAGSCIKGYFHGLRSVRIPMNGDTAEFAVKWLCMGALIFLPVRMDFYMITAAAVFAGETVSFVYYLAEYIRNRPAVTKSCGSCPSWKDFLADNIPIVIGGYVQMILSAANDLIVPAALLGSCSDTGTAFGQYGMFEAMIIPAIFFPASAMGSMSNIMIAESASAAKAGGRRLCALVRDSLTKACSYSFFIAGSFVCFGRMLGDIICPADSLVGDSLVILAPVIPFIYLEIIMEGILKGIGKQNFCTLNSLAEYTVRIACVLIFVPMCGFTGIIISYYASNCMSNIVRIAAVTKASGGGFDIMGYIVIPLIRSIVCCAAGTAVCALIPAVPEMIRLAAGCLSAAAVYLCVPLHGIKEDHRGGR